MFYFFLEKWAANVARTTKIRKMNRYHLRLDTGGMLYKALW
jgi:hypothetical protein